MKSGICFYFMKVLYTLIIFTASLLLMLVISPLRGHPFGMGYSSLAGFVFFFFLSLFNLKKFNTKILVWQILFAQILGLWIIQLPIRIVDFESTLGSLPDVIIHTLGILCGYYYWHLKKPFSILAAISGILVTVFMFFQGYDLWFHKLNFDTFTGRVSSYTLPAKFEAFDEQKNLLTNDNLQNKVVLMDFWTTTCGICFKKFPQVQTVYDKYKYDSSVMIMAVNTPIEEDKPNQAFNDIREEGHSFPIVITKDEDLAEKYGVKGYPTTFVINRNGQIVYKGDIEGAVEMVDELKKNE